MRTRPSRPVSIPDDHGGFAEPLLTVRDLASYLKITTSTVYRMVERRQIPVLRLGATKRSLRFRPDEITRWIDQGGQDSLGEL